jgi:hypothetical protein
METMIQLYRLIGAVYGDRKKYCYATYSECDGSTVISNEIHNNFQYIVFEHGLQSEDYEGNNEDEEERSAENEERNTLKSLCLMKKNSALKLSITWKLGSKKKQRRPIQSTQICTHQLSQSPIL